MENKTFIASYSGGKDSALALFKAKELGYTPMGIITAFNTDKERSWFHGVPEKVLENVASSIGCPLWLIKTSGSRYTENFEKTLVKAKAKGVNYCVFGDIDIKEHRSWCTARCENAGIVPLFPLWNSSRESLVKETISLGFTANITIIDKKRMSDRHLGKPLTNELILSLKNEGVDVCGENGEYHTFVSTGPIFKEPIKFTFGEKIEDGQYSILPVKE